MPLKYTNKNLHVFPWYRHIATIIDACNELRELQDSFGAIKDAGAAKPYMLALVESLSHLISESDTFHIPYLHALIHDIEKWSLNPEKKHDFSESFAVYSREDNCSFGLLLFPLYDLTYRTKNVRLEACLFYRNENAVVDRLRLKYPTVFQGVEMLAATDGLLQNNIFTLFPENIMLSELMDQKKFAYFFINRYSRIFFNITKPLGQIAVLSELTVFEASENEIYDARSSFSYIHDFYHYSGILPFNHFYQLKTTLLGSFFEEVRVDVITYLELIKQEELQCQMAAELILLERLVRYCYTNEPHESFDTLTNYFLFSYLLEEGAIDMVNLKIRFNFANLRVAMEKLALDIDRVERKMLCAPTHTFEMLVKEWAGEHLHMDDNGKVCRTLYADWLRSQAYPHIPQVLP